MLVILEEFVMRRGYKYLKLDGQTCISNRQPLIDKFNKDESYFVMLFDNKSWWTWN
uniref:Dna excision repair protein ercc-6 n=1 Tax=Triatoma infestans TaxID=30076 RepID=A0A161MS31_TRIIF